MKRVIALAAFQILTIAGWAGHEEHVRATARSFRIPLRPADPITTLPWRVLAAHPLDEEIDPGAPDVALGTDEVQRFLGTRKFFFGAALVGFCPRGDIERVCALAPIESAVPSGPARHWARAFVRLGEAPFTPKRPVGGSRINFQFDRLLMPVPLPQTRSGPGFELEVADRPGQPLLPLRLWFRGQAFELS
jgi:hypothetical protein